MAVRTAALYAVTLLSVSATGCIRREGRNSDCRWPGESPIHSAGARHLSADAEFAEDLAIRYADTHFGLRTPGYVSGEVCDAARDRCMASLFGRIAQEHGVPVETVSSALGRNRAPIDIAIGLPFLLFYAVAAIAVARWVRRRYPPAEDGWVPAFAMALFLSLVLGAAATMLGEVWSWMIEGYRIGNGHMSYRAQRLWWARHRPGVFAGAAAAFWLAAAAIATTSARAIRSESAARPSRS